MKYLHFSFILLLLLVLVPVSAQDELPDVINFTGTSGLLPEGVEWDANRGQFLVSSQGEGLIQTVADDGTLTPLIQDDDLIFSNGIHIDEIRNRLLVTTTDVEPILDCDVLRQEQPFTGVAVYDLDTLERIALYDLSSVYPNFGSMTNDLTVDPAGNIYATDWCGSGVTKIDTDGNIIPLVSSELFYISIPSIGAGAFNGIDWHPNGYLLVSGGFTTTLYKISVGPGTSLTDIIGLPPIDTVSISPVELDVPAFADGVTIMDNGDVVIIGSVFNQESGIPNATVRYSSDDDFATATLTGVVTYERFATTGVVRDGAFYSIFAGIGEPLTVADYEIVRMDFDAPQVQDVPLADQLANLPLFRSGAGITWSDAQEALVVTGVGEILLEAEAITIVIPTNSAFRNFANEMGITRQELFEDIPRLTEIMNYHIALEVYPPGSVDISDVIQMMDGNQVVVTSVQNMQGGLIDELGRIGGFGLETEIDNGYAYPISEILLPRPFEEMGSGS